IGQKRNQHVVSTRAASPSPASGAVQPGLERSASERHNQIGDSNGDNAATHREQQDAVET
ncbi:MAG TPA: hypothetical protein VKA61_09500, partial [Sphingomicrobium sp.]|nr:hypothetical protein [Sphingomicrobium sp.]